MTQDGNTSPGPGFEIRLCTSCDSPVNPHALFCENCGHRLDGPAPGSPRRPERAESEPEPEPESEPEVATALAGAVPADPGPLVEDASAKYLDEFDARESQKLARALYEQHLELLTSYRKQVSELVVRIDDHAGVLDALAAQGMSRERTADIQHVLEELEELGDAWEELQLAYNRDSEAIDEDFLDQFAEMEVDVELPPELQESMAGEIETLTHSFDHAGARVSGLGERGHALLSQGEGRWFGAVRGGRAGRLEIALWLLGWAAALALLHLVHGVPRIDAIVGTSPIVAVWLLVLILRSARG